MIAAATIAIVVAILAGVGWYLDWAEQRDFAEALAETDRLDPGWRLEEMNAIRTAIPAERNAALQVLKVHDTLGPTVGINFKLEEQIGRLPCNVQLNAEQITALKQYFEQRAKAQAEARALKNLPNGRFPKTYDPQAPDSFLTALQRVRAVMHFLQLDMLLTAQEDDVDIAAVCRAGINGARSIGEEPSVIGHLVRVACLEIALGGLERSLAQTTPRAAELQALQELLQEEIDAPRLRQAMRGERAIGVETMEMLQDGRLPQWPYGAPKGSWRRWLPDWVPASLTVNRANYVRAMNELVAASNLPVEKQLDETQRIVDRWQRRDGLLSLSLPALSKYVAAHARSHARLRCAVVALAAERHRAEQEFWPASVEALVKSGYLKTVPLDPFDAKPLRFQRLPDGVLVYSVGVDRVDNGGVVDRQNPVAAGTDIGFRLWDPDQRRRPAPLPAPDKVD
jgi:hypothetical protein